MGFSSQAGQLVLRKQTAKGVQAVDLAEAGIGIKLRSGSMSSNRELLIPDAEIGGGRDIADAYLGAVSWSGDFDFYVRTDVVATLLNGVLGIAAAPVTELGVTTHVITPSDAAQLPFFSIEEKIGNGLETYLYRDAVINSFHLESDANGYLTGTCSFIGARQIAGGAPTALPDWDETPMFVGTNINIEYGGVRLPAKSFSLDIANNFEDDDFRLGSLYLEDLTPKRREVTASFGIRHDNSAMWRQAVYGSAAATVPGGLTVKSPLTIEARTYEVIPTSTTNYALDIEIPSFALTPFSFEASGDDILENDVEGQALRPVAATPILTATVKTGKATIS